MTLNGPGPLERATRLWRLDGFPSDNASEGPLAFLRLVSALTWRYKFTLVAATAIGLLAAAIYAQSLPRIYNATATLLLEPRRSAFTGHDVSSRQDLDLNSAESELQIIRSERLLSEVFESLGLEAEQTQPPGPLKSLFTYTLNLLPALSGGGPAGAVGTERDKTGGTAADGGEGARRIAFLNFVNRLNARRIGQSYVVEIEYSSTDPDLPARVANATASGYILQSVAFKEQMARAGTDTLQGRLDALAAQVHAAREAMESGTLPKIATPDADARIIGAALPPLGASSPRRSLIAALGGVLGLFIGMAAIAFKVIFDRRVRNANDLSQEIGIPCQASIPDAGQKTGIAWQMDSPALKAYASAIRDLRTSIEIACASQRRERNIIVALIGSGPGTGASTLSFSLARLLSRSGRQVTVFFSSLHMNCGNASSSSASLADVALSPILSTCCPSTRSMGSPCFQFTPRSSTPTLLPIFVIPAFCSFSRRPDKGET